MVAASDKLWARINFQTAPLTSTLFSVPLIAHITETLVLLRPAGEDTGCIGVTAVQCGICAAVDREAGLQLFAARHRHGGGVVALLALALVRAQGVDADGVLSGRAEMGAGGTLVDILRKIKET